MSVDCNQALVSRKQSLAYFAKFPCVGACVSPCNIDRTVKFQELSTPKPAAILEEEVFIILTLGFLQIGQLHVFLLALCS